MQEQPYTEEKRRNPKRGRGTIEFLVTVAIAFALVFGVVRPFIVEAFYIPSESMVPTLMVGDRILANKFIYDFTDPKRGDIVVFKSVDQQNTDLIKRVIGLPGDRVVVRNGKVSVNGKRLKEPYVNKQQRDFSNFGPVRVPPHHYFFMGDNRANSEDSRYFGSVPKKNLVGEAFARFWPLNRIGLL